MKKCSKINTLLQCVDSELPSIARLKKYVGEDSLQAYIEAWIVNLTSFINVGKSMSDDQIYQTAAFILQEYPILNLADINLIFKKAKLGQFGKLYDRLDGQLILSWFEDHLCARMSICAQRSIDESKKFKGDNCPTLDTIAKLANLKEFK